LDIKPINVILVYIFYEVARQLEMSSGEGSEGNGNCVAYSEVCLQMEIGINF